MLARYWKETPPNSASVTTQYRQGHKGSADILIWDPKEGPQDLLDHVEQHGRFDTMFVFAGVTPAPDADLEDNVEIARACLDGALAAEIPKVLLASSSAVYGPGAGLEETSKTNPVNTYGKSKLEMEEICPFWRNSGVNVTCLRIGNVAGADMLLLNALKASAETPLLLDRFANGQGPIRSYIGPETLAHVLETLARTPNEKLPHALNIGAPNPVTMEALVQAENMPWQFVDAPDTALQTVTLNCDRLDGLHAFEATDSAPETMIAQWQALRGDK